MARIIFDLDGTLIDSIGSLTTAANALLAEFGRDPLEEQLVRTFVGQGITALVTRVLTHTGGIPGGDIAPHVGRLHAIYNADPVAGTRVYPGVHEALGLLVDAGHTLGVCTQKPHRPSLTLLRALDLMPPVAALTDGDSLPVLKPDPEMLFHTAAQLPDGPILFVGDSEIDAATADAAGVPFLLHMDGYCHVPRAGLPKAGQFDRYAELPGLVAALVGNGATT